MNKLYLHATRRNKLFLTNDFIDDVIIILFFNNLVTAQPICLPESWSVTNNNGILVGWGKAAGQIGE